MRDEFLIARQGKQYVLFAGLLDEAHERGLRGIDTELVQVPSEANGNVAVVKATVEMVGASEASEDCRTFSGIGDASPENVSRNIIPHLIRMAETRAKARALRDAVNVGATALEELSDGDDAPPTSSYSSSTNQRSGSRSGPRAVPQQSASSRSRDAEQNSGQRSGPQPVESDGQSKEAAPSRRPSGKSGSGAKARKSQIDLLKTLAVELRGENGVERLEGRIGKSLSELTRGEADEWIDRLTPEENGHTSAR